VVEGHAGMMSVRPGRARTYLTFELDRV
jgi:hypothetical protein